MVLAALAGARRSAAALPQFLAASRTTDTLVWMIGSSGRPGQPARTDLAAELRAVAPLCPKAVTWFCRQAFDDPDGRGRVLAPVPPPLVAGHRRGAGAR